MAARGLLKKRLWTYDELTSAMPETNQPTEIWDGDIVMPPAPSVEHQEISNRLEEALRNWVRKHNLGLIFHAPLDVVLGPRRVVQPDILYISHARGAIIQHIIRGAPDLVVEVVSPGSWRRDYVDKKELYEQFGIREYWIVDPEANMVEVLALEQKTLRLLGRFGAGECIRSQLLAGFEMEVDEVLKR